MFPLPEALKDKPRGLSRAPAAASGPQDTALREGSYLMQDGVLPQVVDGAAAPVPIRKGEQKDGLFQKHARIIQALVPVRDAARAVLRA